MPLTQTSTTAVLKRVKKFFYIALIKQHMIWPQNAISEWNMDLQTDDTDTKLVTICSQISCNIPVKLRSFYFKFKHRALTCN